MFISLTTWLSSKWFFFLLFKAEDVSPVYVPWKSIWGMLDLRSIWELPHVNVYVWYSFPAVEKRCNRDPHQYSYQVILKWLKTEVIRNMLFSSSAVGLRKHLIDLQRYTAFLILDQPEKTLGSVRLKCKFFPFFIFL